MEEEGKCKLIKLESFNSKSWDVGLSVYFGANTKFDFGIDGNRVLLSRKNIELEIPKEDFDSKFKIIK